MFICIVMVGDTIQVRVYFNPDYNIWVLGRRVPVYVPKLDWNLLIMPESVSIDGTDFSVLLFEVEVRL